MISKKYRKFLRNLYRVLGGSAVAFMISACPITAKYGPAPMYGVPPNKDPGKNVIPIEENYSSTEENAE